MKKNLPFLVFACAISVSPAKAQRHNFATKTIINNGDSITVQMPDIDKYPGERFYYVDTLARFNGNLDGYLEKQVARYKVSRENQGRTVVVKFVVDTDGSVQDPVIISDANVELDPIAISIVKNMPLWIPAMKDREGVVSFNSIRLMFP